MLRYFEWTKPRFQNLFLTAHKRRRVSILPQDNIFLLARFVFPNKSALCGEYITVNLAHWTFKWLIPRVSLVNADLGVSSGSKTKSGWRDGNRWIAWQSQCANAGMSAGDPIQSCLKELTAWPMSCTVEGRLSIGGTQCWSTRRDSFIHRRCLVLITPASRIQVVTIHRLVTWGLCDVAGIHFASRIN